ncbi:aconitate hydratase AcnA [Paraburkholderia caffeinilytica]|uniref:aconitate hydratase AcnA n=1 Tax=Paraburkholderia caffeinilytica TaxID=1761016 RepID=UPI0038B92919
MFDCLREFEARPGVTGRFYSLPALEQAGLGCVSRLPVSLRMVLESMLRNYDGVAITKDHIRLVAGWQPNGRREHEIPFVPSRVMLPESSGIPILVDLAAMRNIAARLGADVETVQPCAPVSLIVDHSVQVDDYGDKESARRNAEREFDRNTERFRFLKWASGAFPSMKIVPPGFGICHQINMEYLTPGIWERNGVYFPDSLVGADSHTPMINGLGVLGWGVGGIEAEACMLGQPIYFVLPDVVGVHLTGRLREGVTATDAVLWITQRLRETNVVNKFVEYFGEGAAALAPMDRATIANMSPEYGSTTGFFPMDESIFRYLEMTGRDPAVLTAYRSYYEAQRMWGMPMPGDCDYTATVEISLTDVEPSVAGPRRPQDRIALSKMKEQIDALLAQPLTEGGFGKHDEREMKFQVRDAAVRNSRTADSLAHADIVLAAITSCTNTSNPSVMLCAALLARNAVAKGLRVAPWIKTSLAPGSRVVSDYLSAAGLVDGLEALGFHTVGYGCTTCIGNSGPLDADTERAIVDHDIVAAAVLSGNRNFEARIHPNIRMNFLMSPPLVVAFAIAGRVDIDLTREQLGADKAGLPVYLKDIWPSNEDIENVRRYAANPEVFRRIYASVDSSNPLWDAIDTPAGAVFPWDATSSYLKMPPFADEFTLEQRDPEPVVNARALALFGDSVTTDHISPGGAISEDSPAGRYLRSLHLAPADFNTYSARRANHEVLARGTFANVRIRNRIAADDGPVTVFQPDGRQLDIYDAATAYAAAKIPLVVIAGRDYGMGSSRDQAAKGTRYLGVRAVIASSFERIHRGNLVGMGILPCEFADGHSAQSLGLDGSEQYGIALQGPLPLPRERALLDIRRADGTQTQIPITIRIDSAIEAEYYRHGGIVSFVLRKLLGYQKGEPHGQ